VFVCHNIVTNPEANSFPAVSSFTVNPDGTLNYAGNYFTNNNPYAISVSPNGRFVAVSHASSSATTEDLLVFRVEPDASLTMWAVFATPDSPLDVEWVTNGAVACTETDSSGPNFVHVYRFVETNPIHSRLTLIDTEEIGANSAYLQGHPSGGFLFANDAALGGAGLKIRTFKVNEDDTLSFVSDAFTSLYPLDMAVTHDGSTLYSGAGIGLLFGGDPHRVHGFSIDPDTGSLGTLEGSPYFSPGDAPAHVTVTGDDQFLLVGHGGDGDVRSFQIDSESGSLTDTGNVVSVGGQGDIGGIAALDRFLFATKRFSSTGSPSGLRVYQVDDFGGFIQIGGDIDTFGSGSDAVAVWKPAACAPGDINCDAQVNDLDIAAFVSALLGTPQEPIHVGRSDLNGDAFANGLDVPGFVGAYLNAP
jgi:6-phosphogluconolactonase (cycloisomerase 2 family)